MNDKKEPKVPVYYICFVLDLSPFGNMKRLPMEILLLASNDFEARKEFDEFMRENHEMHQGKRYLNRPKLVQKIVLAEA